MVLNSVRIAEILWSSLLRQLVRRLMLLPKQQPRRLRQSFRMMLMFLLKQQAQWLRNLQKPRPIRHSMRFRVRQPERQSSYSSRRVFQEQVQTHQQRTLLRELSEELHRCRKMLRKIIMSMSHSRLRKM